MGTSSGFRSAAMLFRYFGGISAFAGPRFGIHHIPDKSGLPSGPRGAGAERFGFPSALRGTFLWVTLSHCARAGAADSIPTNSQYVAFIWLFFRVLHARSTERVLESVLRLMAVVFTAWARRLREC